MEAVLRLCVGEAASQGDVVGEVPPLGLHPGEVCPLPPRLHICSHTGHFHLPLVFCFLLKHRIIRFNWSLLNVGNCCDAFFLWKFLEEPNFQCFESGMIYSGFWLRLFEVRILPMLFKHVWKKKNFYHSKRRIHQLSATRQSCRFKKQMRSLYCNTLAWPKHKVGFAVDLKLGKKIWIYLLFHSFQILNK